MRSNGVFQIKLSEYLNGLDDITVPVIICNLHGIVIYKNQSAVRNVKLPRRNTHMVPHLDSTANSEFEQVAKRNKPSIINVNTGERNARAFVCAYTRNGQACTLWVFVPMMQINAISRVFLQAEERLTVTAYQICEIIKDIDKIQVSTGIRQRDSIDRKISDRIERILNYLFSFDINTDDKCLYNLQKSIEMLVEAEDRTFGKVGYHINYSFTDMEYAAVFLIDFRCFSSIYSHMLIFAAQAAIDRSVSIDVSQENSYAHFKAVFTVPYPPIFTLNDENIMNVASLLPKRAIDILIFKKICEFQKYRCSFSVNDSEVDNVCINVAIPITISTKLRAVTEFSFEAVSLERDQMMYFAYLIDELQNQQEL